MIVTCITPDCSNEGIPIEIPSESSDGGVQCGPCGNWIIAPVEPPAPEELPSEEPAPLP